MPNWDKRASNREFSTNLLIKECIPFVSKNGGAHLIVNNFADFYPGTGLWIQRATKGYVTHLRQGRGVYNLLKIMKEEING